MIVPPFIPPPMSPTPAFVPYVGTNIQGQQSAGTGSPQPTGAAPADPNAAQQGAGGLMNSISRLFGGTGGKIGGTAAAGGSAGAGGSALGQPGSLQELMYLMGAL